MAGVTPYTVEIEEGTVINFWVPKQTVAAAKGGPTKPTKPVVVLIHGFAAEGIVTWQFQVVSLTKQYAVYVPDLLFFGGSTTDRPDRTPAVQAECLAKGLRKLGVEKCVLVGFSYGGMVAFKMAQLYPYMVRAMVITGSLLALTESMEERLLRKLGISSSSEFLLPTSLKGLKKLLSLAAYKKFWFPDRLLRDYLKVYFAFSHSTKTHF